MLTIQPCRTYHAVLSGTDTLRCEDGKSVFKVYFIDIIGRPDPARTVWEESGIPKQAFLDRLGRNDDVEGLGFVTAFPHITKVFRYAPASEVVVNVRAWNTRDMTPIDLARDAGYVEFACLAEAIIAADECRHWAAAQSVDEYLKKWSDFRDGPIARHDKLLAYWQG